MEGIPNSVIDFFNRYPDADEVFEVAEQLFHANAKDAAEARANFYGKEIKTYKQSDVLPPAPEGGSNEEEDLTPIINPSPLAKKGKKQ